MPSGAFITQVPGQNASTTGRGGRSDEINELEALVSGVTQTSQSTLLLKKKKEMREVNDALAFMKRQYLEKMQAADESHAVFERKQLDMKDQVVKFEKFIQENDSKRGRAEVRAREERKKVVAKQEELDALVIKLREEEALRAEKLEKLNSLIRYKEYLDATVDHADEGIEQIDDILNRLTTLEGANKDLMDQVNNNDSEMDDVTSKLQSFVLETQNHVLVQNSKVHNYQNDLERLRATTKKGRDDEEAKQDRVKDVNRETGQIVMAIRNLYGRCCASSRTMMPAFGAKASMSNFEHLEKCLTFIEERIVDLKEVSEGHEEVTKHAADALPPIPSAAGDKSSKGRGGGAMSSGGVKAEGSAFL
jgi:hypothetical protein